MVRSLSDSVLPHDHTMTSSFLPICITNEDSGTRWNKRPDYVDLFRDVIESRNLDSHNPTTSPVIIGTMNELW